MKNYFVIVVVVVVAVVVVPAVVGCCCCCCFSLYLLNSSSIVMLSLNLKPSLYSLDIIIFMIRNESLKIYTLYFSTIIITSHFLITKSNIYLKG